MNDHAGITPVLDYKKLAEISSRQAMNYQQASPFPHIVLDNLFDPQFIAALIREFPNLKERAGQTPEAAMTEDGKLPQPNKLWLSNQLGVSRLFRHLYWELNSAPFLEFLEKITGIRHLIPDPHLAGGGVHQTRRDGLLMIHADFNKHPQYQLDRRINFLLYLNEDWQDEWGGHLELWEKDMSRCVQRVAPVAGRCVIFSTTRDSFHGHPHPLTCPADKSRKSVALYYYTNGRPANEDPSPHKTIWKDVATRD
ncbi:MAG TPA: 2OG-Fe(II) oxygenase [Pseudomonadales bacterium]|nr:2OG-Fe(II) oxygenase [Pseudomonadales bacterium]